jgi:hypothetical protein
MSADTFCRQGRTHEPCDPRRNRLFARLPDVRLLQRLFARVVPRAQIEGLAALNLVNLERIK